MGKSEIRVSCNDQVLKITDAPVLAAGGLNEVRVIFSFCEKWVGFVKTAIFYRDEEEVYYAVLDENDTCIVPWEVCYEEGAFYFGVFGERDSIRRTSNVVKYKVRKGAINPDMMPSEPSPGVYDQFLTEIAKIRADNEAFVADVENTLTEATGHNIASIEKTGTAGLVDTYTITFLDESTQTYTVTNGARGQQGEQGASIYLCNTYDVLNPGGGTFVDVDASPTYFTDGFPKANELFITQSGYIGCVRNVRIGTTNDGKTSHTFSYQFVANLNGQRGEKGNPGIQGEKGDKGDPGEKGRDGYTPLKGIDYFDGEKGDPGYTPVKGVDYFTESDIAEVIAQASGLPHLGILPTNIDDLSLPQGIYEIMIAPSVEGIFFGTFINIISGSNGLQIAIAGNADNLSGSMCIRNLSGSGWSRWQWTNKTLTFTGAVTGTYDGTSDVTINVPATAGEKGDPGAPGYTPLKGIDYYTEADKTEMVNAVLAALPAAEGVAF